MEPPRGVPLVTLVEEEGRQAESSEEGELLELVVLQPDPDLSLGRVPFRVPFRVPYLYPSPGQEVQEVHAVHHRYVCLPSVKKQTKVR